MKINIKTRIHLFLGTVAVLCVALSAALIRHGILLDDAISSLSYARHYAVYARLRDRGCGPTTCARLVAVLESQTESLQGMAQALGTQAEVIVKAGVCVLGPAIIVSMTWYATIRHLKDR